MDMSKLEQETVKVFIEAAIASAIEDYPGYVQSGRRRFSQWVADRVSDVIFKEIGEQPDAPFDQAGRSSHDPRA